jgi:hypothetical protein|tara:strand:+ start:430 stop:603 length:174 start_codon:yes stop_codon:yes gene_type:complete
MLKPFKVTKKHLVEYPYLDGGDVGMYAIRIKEEQELMLYETKQIASKAFEYFQKNFK